MYCLIHQKVLGEKKKKRFQSEQKWRQKKKRERGKYEDWIETMVEFVFFMTLGTSRGGESKEKNTWKPIGNRIKQEANGK